MKNLIDAQIQHFCEHTYTRLDPRCIKPLLDAGCSCWHLSIMNAADTLIMGGCFVFMYWGFQTLPELLQFIDDNFVSIYEGKWIGSYSSSGWLRKPVFIAVKTSRPNATEQSIADAHASMIHGEYRNRLNHKLQSSAIYADNHSQPHWYNRNVAVINADEHSRAGQY